MKTTALIITLAMLVSPYVSRANPVAPAAIAATNSVVTAEDFLKIKTLVMTEGDRVTYCNMYNHNPHYGFQELDIFLNPDSGQSNINCDTNRSDFNYMVLRTKKTPHGYIHLRLVTQESNKTIVELLQGAKEEDVTRLFTMAIDELTNKTKGQPKASEATGAEASPKSVFAELVAELESHDPEKRNAACQGLAALATGTPIPDAIPMVERLAESDPYKISYVAGKDGSIGYMYPVRKAASKAIEEHMARSMLNDFLSQRTEPMPKRLVIALVNGQRIDLVAYDANIAGSDAVLKEAMVTKVSSPEVLNRLLGLIDRLGGNSLKYIDSYVLEWHGNDAMMLTAISGARRRMKKPQDAIPALVEYSEKHLADSKVDSDEWRVFCQYLVACKQTSIIPMLIPSLSDKRIHVNYTAQLPPPPRRYYVIRTEVYNYLAELTGKPIARGIEETDKAVKVWIEWWEREGKEQYNQALHTDGNTHAGTNAAPAETE